ncbi:MAG: RNA-guided pseudouridylation complex pseudouridine synthase subunit Cbf5 [Thermoplasmataceae archaeon]
MIGSWQSPESEPEGFIVIDKPKGPTSHQVDFWVRKITGCDRVGHIGTLDPNVSGVLVMAMGRATKLIEIAHEEPKEYICVMRTYADVPEDRIREVLKEFTGDIYQLPPVRSAVARNLRIRKIYSIDLMEYAGRLSLLKIKCESGTYIRTLCTDMGYALGCGAQMAELRRTATGPFNEEHMVTLQELKDAVYLKDTSSGKRYSEILLPVEFMFRGYPKIVVKNSSLENIAHGSDLFPGGIKAIIGTPSRGERVCVVSEDNYVVGTGKMMVSYNDILDLKVVDFDRILISPRTKVAVKNEQIQKRDIVVRQEKRQGRPPVQRFGTRPRRDTRRLEERKNPRNTGGEKPGWNTGFKGNPYQLRKKKNKGRIR